MMRRLARTVELVLRARRQARFPFRPLEEIDRAGRRRTRTAIRHAADSVPFYRDALERAGARPEEFREPGDLARLPVVTPGDFQRDAAAFTSARFGEGDGVTVRSGGSTAEPKAVRHDAAALFANAAHGERERSIVARFVGRPGGYREVVVVPPFASAFEVQRFVRERLALPRRLAVRRRYLSLLDGVEANVPRVAGFRPHVLHTYGSYAGPLLREMHDRGTFPDTLRVLWYSSDALPEADRRFVVGSLGLAVLSTYQAVEAFKIGFECGEGEGIHLNIDLYPVRIVDESSRDVPVGETGAVVVSNLVNRATVLLNYRIGDRAAMLSGPCPCGRTLPRMTFPVGREEDWVEGPDGRRAHPQAVTTLFTEETEILTYQVVQRAPGRFDLLLIAAEGVDRESAERRLTARFVERFGAGTVIESRWVERLERSPGGKVRPVIRR